MSRMTPTSNIGAASPNPTGGADASNAAAFTPGPWSVERIDYDLHGLDVSFEVSAGMRTVVQTHMREIKSEGEWIEQDEANCRLIAAAPELYAAVEALMSRDWTFAEAEAKALAALAKARGETA